MLQEKAAVVIDQLIDLRESTTIFLEFLRNQKLKPFIESQQEMHTDQGNLIRRIVKLYFNTPEEPLLYCISWIYIDHLKEDEYYSILKMELPIGRIFYGCNHTVTIEKREMETSRINDSSLSSLLHVTSSVVYEKKYKFWVGDRYIASIHEYFNEESLCRL